MPRIYGPAKGFLNKVCIINPQTASADPQHNAAIDFGNLKFKMISEEFGSDDKNKNDKIFLIPISFVPADRENKKEAINSVTKINK